MGILETEKLKIHRIQEDDMFADNSFNFVIDDIDKKVVGISHEQDKSHWEMWKESTQYQKGDVVRTSRLKSNQYMVCTNAGTSC